MPFLGKEPQEAYNSPTKDRFSGDASTTAFTLSGSNIVFASALTSSDVIDFILVLGSVLLLYPP